MKSLALLSAALVLGFALVTGDAEAAKRLGGGKSSGMQRESVTAQKSPAAAPAPNQAAAPGAAQAQPKRSWMGPLAGLAAGLGLAALASHFGFGEELASMLMIGLLVMAVIAVIGFVMRRRAAAQQPALAGAGGMQYAGPDRQLPRSHDVSPGYSAPAAFAGGEPAATSAATTGNIPAGFDVESFVRNAKVNFIRLQAANDAGNLDDLREFTTPEMYAELKLDIDERQGKEQHTEVMTINAETLEALEEGSRQIVSVRFYGTLREDDEATISFDEIWHMSKPLTGNQGWVVAGIQQNN